MSVTYTDEQGARAVMALQGHAGIEEKYEKALQGWKDRAPDEKEATEEAHRACFPKVEETSVKPLRGFAAMPTEQQRLLASKGGKAAHAALWMKSWLTASSSMTPGV